MNVDAWGLVEDEVGRTKRLAVGFGAGVLVMVALAGVLATARGVAAPKPDEEILDVKLASAPSAAPPPPPPPAPPPLAEPTPPKPAAPIGRKAIIAPKEVPTEAPKEADKPLKPAPGPDEYADGKGGVKGGIAGGDPNGIAGGSQAGTGAAPSPPPPPPPPTPPAGPMVVTEDMTPASPLSTPDPPVPDEARSQGVSATIVVRFTITETGNVTDVAIVRGSHPLLDPVILRAVSAWRYKPALTADGKAVSSKKTKTFRYNFKS